MTEIRCPLNLAAEMHGDRLAIILADKTISYAQYHGLVAATARRLQKFGIKPGQRVAVQSDNSCDYVILLMALLKAGAVACPVSPRYPEARTEGILRQLKAAFFVSDGPVLSKTVSGGAERLALPDMIDRSGIEQADSTSEVDLERDATIVLTSGTTGQPKAVLHTLGSHYYSALGANENIALGPGDRWLLSLPLYHVGGLAILFRAVLAGAAVALPVDRHEPLKSIEQLEITHVSVVSTQLYRMLALKASWPTLRAVLLGGGPPPPALVQSAHKTGLPLFTSYGSTEMASQITTTRPGDAPEKLQTSGRLLEHRDLKIGTENEIMVRGQCLCKGYVDWGAVTGVETGGWFATGDLGHIDADGYLVVTGRKDHMFISGGENIQPEEIERALTALDSVERAVIVPWEDVEFGFRPVAFVKWRGRRPKKSDVIERLRRELPGFKIPVSFYEWPERDSLALDKPDRDFLAELACESGGEEFK